MNQVKLADHKLLNQDFVTINFLFKFNNFVNNSFITVAPKMEKIKNIVVKSGQLITVETSFEAEPEPTATWSVDGKQIVPDQRISTSLTPNNIKLIILSSKRVDTGKYTIKLTNSQGSDSSSFDVTVLCKYTLITQL